MAPNHCRSQASIEKPSERLNIQCESKTVKEQTALTVHKNPLQRRLSCPCKENGDAQCLWVPGKKYSLLLYSDQRVTAERVFARTVYAQRTLLSRPLQVRQPERFRKKAASSWSKQTASYRVRGKSIVSWLNNNPQIVGFLNSESEHVH